MSWIWVDVEVAVAAHAEQLAEHGGAAGIRDRSMLESAMARPQNLVAYGDPDIADLAASYAFGIARNHPFVDGNKRTAAVVSETFLVLNGHALACSDVELVVTFLAFGRRDERRRPRHLVPRARHRLTRNARRWRTTGGHLSSPGKSCQLTRPRRW